tara:strand:- start:36 stop:302 length:267 start_codon:yes stop_codon:yes gene_type:complete
MRNNNQEILKNTSGLGPKQLNRMKKLHEQLAQNAGIDRPIDAMKDQKQVGGRGGSMSSNSSSTKPVKTSKLVELANLKKNLGKIQGYN